MVQYWGVGQDEATELARRAVAQGARLILSPGNHAYLDMKYDDEHDAWSGVGRPRPVSASYGWEPATLIEGVGEESILGVESALWSETTADRAAVEYLAFPRLAGIAEIAWSPAAALAGTTTACASPPRAALGRPRRQLLPLPRGSLASVTVS